MKHYILLICITLLKFSIQAQNVGIGTTNPNFKLTVQSLGFGLLHTDGTVQVGTYTDGTTGQFGTRSNHPLHFFTNNGSPQITLLQNSNVGMGTTIPQTDLHINPNGAGSLLIGTNKNSGGYTNIEMGISSQSNGYGYLQATKASGSSYGSLVINPVAGNVGIGTTTPTSTLDVHGGISLPIKVVTADYTTQNNDYTIVVNMQNDNTKIINIYLPPQYVNNGRIIKIVPQNMISNNGYDAYPDLDINLINIYDASGTVLYKTLYNRYYQENKTVFCKSNTGLSSYFFQTTYFEIAKITSVTLQCISTSGWIVTDSSEIQDRWSPL